MKLTDLQLSQVDAQIKRLIQTDSYYGRIYKEAGITGVSSQEEFEQLPFSSKADLRNAYPLGIQAVPDEEVVRIHSSSGTTGKPVIIPYTAKDVDDWAIMFARCYETAGITNKDHIQITAGYGLWTAGIGFQAGCEKLGAMAIPMGPGNTDKQIQMMMDLKSTVLTATSSYALLLAEEINKRGIRDQLYLKKGIFGSERWSEKMREYIKRELGVSLYDIYGLTEIYGPGIGISCDENSGMHYWDDYVYIEIVDPKTLQPVPDGEEGEIVITTLVKEGAPRPARSSTQGPCRHTPPPRRRPRRPGRRIPRASSCIAGRYPRPGGTSSRPAGRAYSRARTGRRPYPRPTLRPPSGREGRADTHRFFSCFSVLSFSACFAFCAGRRPRTPRPLCYDFMIRAFRAAVKAKATQS